MIIEKEYSPNVLSISLNRPDKINSLTLEMIARLTEIYQTASHRIIIIKGEGGHFCSGLDIKGVSFEEGFLKVAELLQTMRRSNAINIALVSGVCMAGGLGLMLAADIALSADECRFQLPEVKRGFLPALVLTLASGQASSRFLMEMALTGDIYDPQTLFQKGLINKITPHAFLEEEAFLWIQKILDGAPHAITLTKKLIYESKDFETALSFQRQALQTGEHEEGLKAFSEKRKPQW